MNESALPVVRFAAGHHLDELVEVGQRLGEFELKKPHHATLLVQAGVVGFAFQRGSVVGFRLGVGLANLGQGFGGGFGLAKRDRDCTGEEQHCGFQGSVETVHGGNVGQGAWSRQVRVGLAKRGLGGSLAAMFKVVITDYIAPPVEPEETIFAGLAKVECLLARSVGELESRVEDADAIIVFHEVSLTTGIIDRLEKCRVIVRGGVGYDAVDFRRAGGRGIPVCNVPDYGVDEVADQAIGMMIACSRGFLRVERELKQSLEPWDCRAVEPVPRLAGAILGIVGLGRIGQATAQRAKAMRMRVIAHDPYLRPGIEKVFGVEMVSFDELLETSDAVSLHVPLTDETRQMIDADALGRMKPSAILVNTARGAVVDTAALAAALRAGKIAGAGVDVLPSEPARADEPLVQLWRDADESNVNLILTPHTAFYSVEGLLEMRTKAAEEIVRALRGAKLINCVNAQWLPEEMRERVLVGTPPTV